MPLEGLQKKICPKLFLDFGKKNWLKTIQVFKPLFPKSKSILLFQNLLEPMFEHNYTFTKTSSTRQTSYKADQYSLKWPGPSSSFKLGI